MTELDKYVSAAGREEMVKKVRQQINDLGIQYIYFQFVSVTGRGGGGGVAVARL
jgi:glutamine synthetase